MNEKYFILRIIIEAALIMIAGRAGKLYLYALMIINLLLVPVFGQKIIEVFGIQTNGGNTFYAVAILCFAMLIEKYGMKEFKGVLGYCVFAFMGYITLSTVSHYIIGIDDKSALINTVFTFVPKIMLASLVAFIVSIILFVKIYQFLNNRFPGEYIFRMTNTIVIVQFVDSILFFMFAFWGELPIHTLLIALLYGFLMKSVVSVVLIPFVSFGIGKSIRCKKFIIKT